MVWPVLSSKGQVRVSDWMRTRKGDFGRDATKCDADPRIYEKSLGRPSSARGCDWVRLPGYKVKKAGPVLTECPHSQVAKDPERGLTECLEGGRAAFALVANLLL
jgi:hypothetical protein